MSTREITARLFDARRLHAGKQAARRRLAAAVDEQCEARNDYSEYPHDISYERWRRAEVEYDDAVAVAQEWGVREAPTAETWS